MSGSDFRVLAVVDSWGECALWLVESGGLFYLIRNGPGGCARVRLADFYDSEETAAKLLRRWSEDTRRTPDERAAAERCLREAGLSYFA